MSLKASASWPSSSSRSTGMRPEKSPAATLSAACSNRLMRTESARATRYPASTASTSAIAPATRICRRMIATLSATSLSGDENTTTRAMLPWSSKIGLAA